jgi:hypothetical protein
LRHPVGQGQSDDSARHGNPLLWSLHRFFFNAVCDLVGSDASFEFRHRFPASDRLTVNDDPPAKASLLGGSDDNTRLGHGTEPGNGH